MTGMSNLGPQFHGTTAELRPRSLIRAAKESGRPQNFNGYGDPEYTHSTHSLSNAAHYARLAQDWALNRNQFRNQRVYEVEHTGETVSDPGDPRAVRSRSPMRVIRRVPASEWNV